MALTVTPQSSPLGNKLVEQTATNATPNQNVTGAPGSLLLVEADNTANPAAAVWLKAWDLANPVVGTTPADWVWKIPANTRRSIAIPGGFAFTAFSFACVATANENNAANPPVPILVRLLTT